MPGGSKYTFPNLDNTTSALLCVPMPLVPFFRRFFQDMQNKTPWASHADWNAAYQAFAEMESELMAGCMQQLVDEQQRLYRLWDSALNGTEYEVVAGEILPVLPAVPTSSNATNAMRAHLSRLWQLGENVVAGVTAGPGESIAGAPALPDDATARQLLRRLIQAIDGNGTPAPADNLLMALRGTVEASTARNVIDTTGGGNLADLLDQVEALLIEIRDKLV